MKKIFSLIFILFIMGCAGDRDKNINLDVSLSPYNSKLESKKVGVVPFTGGKKAVRVGFSDAIVDNLLTSGFYVIDQRHWQKELKKSLKKSKKSSADELNEWERFKSLVSVNDYSAIGNLVELRELGLIDFLIMGRLDVKNKYFFFSGDEIMGAKLNIINIHTGAVVYSMNYTREKKAEKITPRQLGKKLVDALMIAMQ